MVGVGEGAVETALVHPDLIPKVQGPRLRGTLTFPVFPSQPVTQIPGLLEQHATAEPEAWVQIPALTLGAVRPEVSS